MSSAKSNNNLYKDQAERINTILGEDSHLHRLKQLADARNAYVKEIGLTYKDSVPAAKFGDWLLERWGIKLTTSDVMGGLSGYEVVDEQKFLLFCMVFP